MRAQWVCSRAENSAIGKRSIIITPSQPWQLHQGVSSITPSQPWQLHQGVSSITPSQPWQLHQGVSSITPSQPWQLHQGVSSITPSQPWQLHQGVSSITPSQPWQLHQGVSTWKDTETDNWCLMPNEPWRSCQGDTGKGPVFVTVFPTMAEELSSRVNIQVALHLRVPHHHLNSHCS